MNDQAMILDARVEAHIDAYEARIAEDPQTPLEEFMPPRSDEQFARIAIELIRVDLENSWERGNGRSLGDYLFLLPELADNAHLRAQVAFEEYRQRVYHGEHVDPLKFARQYRISTDGWSTAIRTNDDTQAENDFDSIAESVPGAGQRWRDFQVIREIGRGALSRVLLAKQFSLAGRLVVLKFAPKHLVEAEKLARLQHSNIVPVFSVYEETQFNVFCMPYLGDLTLEDTAHGLTARGSLEVVLSLANALNHAHERGIFHNDIKPANVLMVEGTPMLLDFNLAAERHRQDSDQIGGTLAYMSPEALQGLTERRPTNDVSNDLYSLGAVLFELVAKRPLFPRSKDVASSIRSRKQRLDLSHLGVSPAVTAILQKCLHPQQDARYPSSRELITDVQRHLQDLPLQFAAEPFGVERFQKWQRRHPRLSSLWSVVMAVLLTFAIGLAAWTAREKHVHFLESTALLSEFEAGVARIEPELSSAGLDAVDLDATLVEAERVLASYVNADGTWRNRAVYQHLPPAKQIKLDATICRLALATATGHAWLIRNGNHHLDAAIRLNKVSQVAAGHEFKAQLFQLGHLLQQKSSPDTVPTLRRAAQLKIVDDANDLQLFGQLRRWEGNAEEAVKHLRKACELQPADYSKRFDLAMTYLDAGAWRSAENEFTACVTLRPKSTLAYYCRGLCRRELGFLNDSIDDFTRFLADQPEHPYGLLNRALVYKDDGDLKAALKDVSAAIGKGVVNVRALLIRARIRRDLGDSEGAKSDRRAAFATVPKDEEDWVARGMALLSDQPNAAFHDFQQALESDPGHHAARRNIAYVLSERLSKPKEAIEVLNEVIQDYPSDASALGGRGVLLARQGEFSQALVDAKRILAMNADARPLLQAACIFSMASVQHEELRPIAIQTAALALRRDLGLAGLAVKDPDLLEIQDTEAFEELCRAANLLSKSALPVFDLGEVQR